jgi:hypothetical protein
MLRIEKTLESGTLTTFEYEIEIGGLRRWKESRMTRSGADEAVSIVRDFTEKRRADAEVRRLAEEQAALRRVATLVAGNAPPQQVFQTVTEEVGSTSFAGSGTPAASECRSPSPAPLGGP